MGNASYKMWVTGTDPTQFEGCPTQKNFIQRSTESVSGAAGRSPTYTLVQIVGGASGEGCADTKGSHRSTKGNKAMRGASQQIGQGKGHVKE